MSYLRFRQRTNRRLRYQQREINQLYRCQRELYYMMSHNRYPYPYYPYPYPFAYGSQLNNCQPYCLNSFSNNCS